MYLVYFLHGYMYILARLLLQSQQTQVNTSKYQVSEAYNRYYSILHCGYSVLVHIDAPNLSLHVYFMSISLPTISEKMIAHF